MAYIGKSPSGSGVRTRYYYTAVDHIVPIKGENVCGLNVPWNLRVVTQRYNSVKSNKVSEHLSIYQSHGSVMIHESALPWNIRN